MPAHTMPEDTNPRPIDLRERLEDGVGQFGRDVTVHFVAFGPGLLCCVDVEAGAGAEVVGGVFAFNVEAACP